MVAIQNDLEGFILLEIKVLERECASLAIAHAWPLYLVIIEISLLAFV